MPLDFESGDAFLGSTCTPKRIAPVAQFDARFLVDRADPHRVLLFAIPAAPQVATVPLSRLGVFHFVDLDTATLDARWRITPALLFQKLDGGQFVAASQRNVLYRLGLRQLPFAILVRHAFNVILDASCVKYTITV